MPQYFHFSLYFLPPILSFFYLPVSPFFPCLFLSPWAFDHSIESVYSQLSTSELTVNSCHSCNDLFLIRPEALAVQQPLVLLLVGRPPEPGDRPSNRPTDRQEGQLARGTKWVPKAMHGRHRYWNSSREQHGLQVLGNSWVLHYFLFTYSLLH